MRSLSLFALILTSLTLAASAQEYKPPKAKPYHSESKEKQSSKGGVADKKLTPGAANSQELRRLEAQTAKTGASSKAAKPTAHRNRVLKTEHEKSNPPIRFSSATGSHPGMNEQGKNPYKGRVRQKGGNR